MRKTDAIQVIVDMVSDYVVNGFPLTALVGEDTNGPDAVNADELATALELMGCKLAAIRVREQIK
jgi:hypothetical protein